MIPLARFGKTDTRPLAHRSWRNLAGLEAALLRPAWPTIGIALAAMLAQAMLLLPLPWLQAGVIDRLQQLPPGAAAAPGEAIGGWIFLVAAASVVCLAGRTALGWLSGSLMSRVSLEFARSLTDNLHSKLQRLPLKYFDRQETGQLMSRLTSDVGTLLIFLSASSLQLVADLVLASGVIIALFVLCWPLAVLSLVVLPLLALSHRRYSGQLRAVAGSVQEHNARLYAYLSERLSAMRVVRACGEEQRELDCFSRQLDEQTQCNLQNLRAGARQSLAALLIAGAASAGMAAAAALLIQRGWLTLGEAVSFMAYVALLYSPLTRLVQFYSGVAATLAAVDRICEILNEPEPPPTSPRRLPRKIRGELQLRSVSFAYSGGPLVLDRINLRIEPGTTVGILGASGAGKSTLMSLIPRLYDAPPGSRILLDRCDIRAFAPPVLRRNVLLVPQQARLFEGTLRQNLTYAARRADDRLIWRVLQTVDLADLVDSLPGGLDAWVGERGASLSGGQRQRVALARALLVRPPVLLLDDCTSALDPQTDALVRRRIADLRPDQTRLVVSHQPQSLAGADWIVELAAGRIARQGTPAEMLRDEILQLPPLGTLPTVRQGILDSTASL